jgi:tol-pal system beta propeller repeat protein TolB
MNKRGLILIMALVLILACNAPGAAPTQPSNLLATLAASTPLSGNGAATVDPAQTPTSAFNLPAPIFSTLTVPTSSAINQPTGHIVYTCQVFKVQASNQICIINADGTGFQRLTTASRQHYYPSLAPDGKSVVYAAFREENIYEIYEMDLATGEAKQLTNKLGILNGPEVSPNGESLIFKHSTVNNNRNMIWIMDRDGQNAENIARTATGWDPTWSPDGKYILFASDMDGAVQLYTIRVNGKELRRISNLPAIRGRSDWSPDGQYIVTYSGEPWKREVYIMNADGTNAHVLSPEGGNSQGPSFSPDGQWVAFTAYFDKFGDDHGCEIYIIRVDGTDLRRLTNNDYCDYQPRWGL